MTKMKCFKAYDVRGRVPEELNDDIAYRIGRAYAAFVNPSVVAVGRDIRHSSAALTQALINGLTDSGVDVRDIGIGGTEMSYFATFHRHLDGGIMVTASHNPPDYNGMKFVREQSRPISSDTGLLEIQAMVEQNDFSNPAATGRVTKLDILPDYIEHLLSYIDINSLRPMKIVVNAGNGGAGPIIDLLEAHLPFEFIKVHHEPDGSFPNGVPNPMLEVNRQATIDKIRESGAALGIAWDGDFDRCFFFDENGRFIEGYYIVGLLAESFLSGAPGERVVHDPRLTWNTLEVVEQFKGESVQSKSGHAFIKQVMRDNDAVYGGEMSAHHYFRDFSYADSGMIPWLLVSEIMCRRQLAMSTLVDERIDLFPASGEINRKVSDATEIIERIENTYAKTAIAVSHIDGVSMEFEDWRFNIRSSNTEPLLRLNVESRGDVPLMNARTEELLLAMGGDPG
jgi:phosphomannomutase